jgi:hypothetical protein
MAMKKTGSYTAFALLLGFSSIGMQAYSEEPAALSPAAQTSVAAPAASVAPPAQTDSAQAPVSPEALDELLAPVALYPDALLAQVLASSTQPQEVLDGGNWLIANPNLKDKEREAAAKAVGFTPPMIALMSFPTVLDMMCMKMEWTTELGEAVLADEPGVRASVQRLRKQAAAMGNLQNSQWLKVDNQAQNGQNVIVVQSPDPKVVYVPQYDPVTTYTTPAPAPVAASAPAPDATATATSTSTTVTEGHSTGTLIATGLLAFGAGILVNEAFDDDDDYHGYPYYPAYGNGFYPSNNYNYNKNTNVNINTGNNDYWNRYDGNRPRRDENKPAWKGKKDYAGARPELRDKARVADGALKTRPATREIAKNRPTTVSDRGRATQDVARPKSQIARPDTGLYSGGRMPDKTANAFQGARNSGKQERAASQRGKQSMQRSGGNASKGGSRAAGRRK